MLLKERLARAASSLRHLRATYCLVYILLCVMFSWLHYVKYSASYTQLVTLSTLNVSALRSVVEWRGMASHEANDDEQSSHHGMKSATTGGSNSQNLSATTTTTTTDAVAAVTVRTTNATTDDLFDANSTAAQYRLERQQERSRLERIIQYSGALYEFELSRRHAIQTSPSRTFNSVGEFLESVEDSRESVWLVHIVTTTSRESDPDGLDACDNTNEGRFVSDSTWQRLNAQLTRFGILTGTFNCARDEFFCRLKGWQRPQLVLGLLKYDLYRSPKEYVQFYTFENCQHNDFDSVVSWLKARLERAERPPAPSSTDLKVFYLQNNSAYDDDHDQGTASTRQLLLPLYYSAISFKYSKHVRFEVISNLTSRPETRACQTATPPLSTPHHHTTPIYVVIMAENGGGEETSKCYNYGTNLNELPNYAHLNQFFLFLYPDMNSIFVISFFFLNSFLVLIFFDYNESLVRQLLRGLTHLLLFNLVLFSIWLLAINTSSRHVVRISEFLASHFLDRLLVWSRYLAMHNPPTRLLTAGLRFFAFYYVYVNPCLLALNYLLVCLLFYAHTRYKFVSARKRNLLPVQQLEQRHRAHVKTSPNETRSSRAKRPNRPSNSMPNDQVQYQRLSSMTVPSRPPSSSLSDVDVDISVSELINQINGVTSIWLQATSYADRLFAELPSIEYCRCLVSRRRRPPDGLIRSSTESCGSNESNNDDDDDDDDNDTDDSGSGDATLTDVTLSCEDDADADNDERREKRRRLTVRCRCGKNDELRAYLEKQAGGSFMAKFGGECSICLEKYALGNLLTLFPCGHLFHRKCIYEWFTNSVNYKCPVCRTSLYQFKKSI